MIFLETMDCLPSVRITFLSILLSFISSPFFMLICREVYKLHGVRLPYDSAFKSRLSKDSSYVTRHAFMFVLQ